MSKPEYIQSRERLAIVAFDVVRSKNIFQPTGLALT